MGMSREERRKRIMERGSDRMALITGELTNLDAASLSSSSASHHRAYSESFAPQLISHDNGTPQTVPAYMINDEAAKTEEPKIKTALQNRQRTAGSILETRQRHRSTFFSSKKLNSSIINSEGSRSFCALVIGFLVVLSYIDYPLTGMNIISSDSIVALKPLYVLLLTDATIVLAHMFMETRGEESEKLLERVISLGGPAGNWAGAEKLLERGLVAYQAFRGVFIDCSVYIVVVVCGLSFL